MTRNLWPWHWPAASARAIRDPNFKVHTSEVTPEMSSKHDPKKSAAASLMRSRPAARVDEAAAEAFEREVLEEIQRERMAKLWAAYQKYVIAAAVAVVLGVIGYQWAESSRIASAEARGGRLAEAVAALSSSDESAGLQQLAAISNEGGAAGALARLRLAAADANAGRTSAALAHYEALAQNRSIDPLISDYARLQSAMLKVDTGDWTDIQNRLNDLAAESSPWRHSARETLGLAALKANRSEDARANFARLLSDTATPPAIAERARIAMATLTAAELAGTGSAGSSSGDTMPADGATTATPGKQK